MNYYPSLRKILRGALDDILSEGSDESVRIRPSILGSCPRKVVLSVMQNIEADDVEDLGGEEDNWGGIGKGALVAGKIYERALHPYFLKEGFLYQCYIVIDKDINLYGHSDFYRPPQSENDEAIIVDLKTTSKKSIPFLPQKSHINQIMLYMHGALHGEIWETDANGNPIKQLKNPQKVCGAILYVIREDPYVVFDAQEYWIEYVEETAQSLINYAAKLNEMVAHGEIPPIPKGFRAYDFPCYYASEFGEVKCAFWETCWRDALRKQGDLSTLGQHAIQEYIAYKESKERYEQIKELIKDALRDYPAYEITTEFGSVVKYTDFRRNVNYKNLIQDLIAEGLVPVQKMDALIEKHTKVQEIAVIRVKPRGGITNG